ncbi:hypothetical protein AB0F25_27905 [Streptomyces wedmorensis]|uniref:hypothetical protein n=1 Tax=Streptomyces wedmorensis TaxID=43759 RepID=UPI00343AE17D
MSAWSWDEGKLWVGAMSQALAEHYGRWTVGWRWAHDEGDFDGGPVGNWCCPRDSITTEKETLARVVAAPREWLESLAGWFEAYPLNLTEVEGRRILWERAARNLILQATDRPNRLRQRLARPLPAGAHLVPEPLGRCSRPCEGAGRRGVRRAVRELDRP